MHDPDGDARMASSSHQMSPFSNRMSYGSPPGHPHGGPVGAYPPPTGGHYFGGPGPNGAGHNGFPRPFPSHNSFDQGQHSPAAHPYPIASHSAAANETPDTSMSGHPGGESASASAQSAGPAPIVYLATYSNVPVFELTIRGIAVMRRRADGYLNATQILKVAGIEKAKRTKILEKEILTGEHEKVQGGYGKYQGTWIPLNRAQELSATYNVAHLLRPVLEFDPRTADAVPTAGPKKRAASNAAPKPQPGSAAKAGSGNTPSRTSETPVKGPTQQPRFLQLRPPPTEDGPPVASAMTGTNSASTSNFLPPDSAQLIGALGGSAGKATVDGIPPGSTSSMRQALSDYSQYGYTPQGVSLPPPTPTKKRAEPDETSSSAEQPSKRARGSQTEANERGSLDAAQLIGPSPVKDLAALAGPGSSLRGASHPRLHRVPLGPPDELAAKAGSARFADRPQSIKPQDEGEKRMRDRLVALFMEEEGTATIEPERDDAPASAKSNILNGLLLELRTAVSLGGAASLTDEGGPAPCIDTVIDDFGHTALHWASALARLSLVKTLVAKPTTEGGANVHAGNYSGETALVRSVLVTNAYDLSLFPELLQLLAPSLHTRDFKNRTVLHHIALVAALKGRATPARYYLACLLEHIAKHEGGRFASIVNAQDEDGETALGIAARQGNNSLVKMLLEVGARKDLANCFGLKPSDWGIDGDSSGGANAAHDSQLTPQTKQELKSGRSDVVTALMRPPQAPLQKSQDVLDQMRSILDELSTTSQRELDDKSSALQTAQAHLQSATRELTSRRKMMTGAQGRVAELEERKIQISNLKKRLLRLQGQEVSSAAISAIQQSQIEELASMAETTNEEVPLRAAKTTADQLVAYRYLVHFYQRSNRESSKLISDIEEEAQRHRHQCRKVVAMTSRIDESKVEAILEDLVSAVESYSEVDLTRLAAFLSRASASAAATTADENPSAEAVAS